MKNYILIIIAIVLDLMIGDPVTPFHPVRILGNFIKRIENFLYKRKLKKTVSGLLAVLIVLGTVLGTFFLLDQFFSFISLGKEIFYILVFYSTIAIKDLAVHGIRVKRALDGDDIILARKNVGMILSRDTEELSRNKIITGTVESMSENSSDSIVAPIFWGLILGPAGSIAYRAINTMDAMWGYKNTRFIDFGRTSAILDDVVNFLPARITGLLICLVSGIISLVSGKNTVNPMLKVLGIMIRDHNKTDSPNAGYPEAAMAGALGIQLGGEASYFGKSIEKPFMGEQNRNPKAEDISKSIKIIAAVLVLFILTAGIIIIKKTGI